MKLGQAIYEKEQAAAASPDADAGAKKDDDVVDAEFSEVDEPKCEVSGSPRIERAASSRCRPCLCKLGGLGKRKQ
ncbi:MAG: hypothetical protein LKM31_02785 [Sphingobium sp.]|jgi:hypothetical protein|nr:hypothetical protein [Sphingobium sp.]